MYYVEVHGISFFHHRDDLLVEFLRKVFMVKDRACSDLVVATRRKCVV